MQTLSLKVLGIVQELIDYNYLPVDPSFVVFIHVLFQLASMACQVKLIEICKHRMKEKMTIEVQYFIPSYTNLINRTKYFYLKKK